MVLGPECDNLPRCVHIRGLKIIQTCWDIIYRLARMNRAQVSFEIVTKGFKPSWISYTGWLSWTIGYISRYT